MYINKFNLLFERNDNYVPVWFMRQAGRYLDEYRSVRKQYANFLDFCYTPEDVCKVTLQPINRFDFDAAIIFSDILVIPDSLGQTVVFAENEGPVLSEYDERYITNATNYEKLNKVYESIKITRSQLSLDKPLIGFCGAPFTLACYMTNYKKTKEYADTKKYMYSNDRLFFNLIDRLTTEVINHLRKQIEAGCDVVKIFDSWAGILHGAFYEQFVINPAKKIVQTIRSEYPNVKIISFARNSGVNYLKYSNFVKPDVLAIDQHICPYWVAENIDKKIVIQGNLDPVLLTVESEFLEKEVRNILDAFKNRKLIFNLGHGITPDAKIENVHKVINLIRER